MIWVPQVLETPNCCLCFPLFFLLHPPFYAGEINEFMGQLATALGQGQTSPKVKTSTCTARSGRPSLWLPTGLHSHRLPVVRHCRAEGKAFLFLLLIPMESYGILWNYLLIAG